MNLRRFSTLQIALGVSVAVHAALLTVRFVDPEGFNRVFEDTPLEVILVNANTQREGRTRPRPSHRPRWPAAAMPTRAAPHRRCLLRPSPRSGDSIEDAQRQVEVELQQQQTVLLLAQKQEHAGR